MKKKQKKKLIKFLVSFMLMLVVTAIGYFRSNFKQEASEQILAKPRNAGGII